MMPSDPLPPSSSEMMPDGVLPPSSPKSRPLLDLPLFEGRLHPLTLVFSTWRGLLTSLLPILSLLLVGNRWVALGILALILGGSVLTALLRYFSFTYRIEAGELVTSGGIISRNVRHIPLDRIQEIRVEQGVVHRLLGVVDARIETAGGGQGAEAVLSVLRQEEVDRLRAAAGNVPSADHFDRLAVRRLIQDLMAEQMILTRAVAKASNASVGASEETAEKAADLPASALIAKHSTTGERSGRSDGTTISRIAALVSISTARA